MTPLYTIRTWDPDLQAYTQQVGLTVPSVNVPWRTLLQVVHELRSMGYSCHRRRQRSWGEDNWNHDDNDPAVLIQRTDGEEPPDGSR